MSKYSTYQFVTDSVGKMVRKNHKNIGFKQKPSNQQALQWLYNQHSDLTQSMDTLILAEEHFWSQNSRVVVFPESTDVLNRLMSGKYDIKDPRGITFPHESFMLCFPKGYEIKGSQVQGVLVTWLPHKNRPERLFKPFFKYVGVSTPFEVKEDPRFQEDYTLMISYRTSNFDSIVTEAIGDGVARAAVPRSMIPDILRCKDGKEYSELLGSFDNLRETEYRLDEKDSEYQFELFKLIAAIAVYSSAVDEALTEGFPGKRPKFLEARDMPRFKDETLSMTKSGDSPTSHYRAWHFRQLRHERFYRGEYAHMAPGSRVIFVSESFAGGSVEAETLKDI